MCQAIMVCDHMKEDVPFLLYVGVFKIRWFSEKCLLSQLPLREFLDFLRNVTEMIFYH